MTRHTPEKTIAQFLSITKSKILTAYEPFKCPGKQRKEFLKTSGNCPGGSLCEKGVGGGHFYDAFKRTAKLQRHKVWANNNFIYGAVIAVYVAGS